VCGVIRLKGKEGRAGKRKGNGRKGEKREVRVRAGVASSLFNFWLPA